MKKIERHFRKKIKMQEKRRENLLKRTNFPSFKSISNLSSVEYGRAVGIIFFETERETFENLSIKQRSGAKL